VIDITINGNNDGVVNNPPTAAIAGPTAGVRGQELTFTVSANDSVADRAAGFRYTIRWGDGTPDTVIARTANNGAGVVVKHTFAANGSFNVTVVATDQGNAASAPATRNVAITSVGIQTDPRNPSGRALFVGGTNGDDCIELNRKNGQLKVKVNGVTTSYTTAFTSIYVFGQAGNDGIEVESSVSTPAMLFGGDGNDLIKAGSGATVLVGGAGNDFLYGGTARDILIGGIGRDVLFGNGDGDILIGSSTSHDNNIGVLGGICDEWASTRSYQTRIANLRNRLNTTTVIDDKAADTLWGSSGMDWYFAELRKSTRDKVYSNAGELVEALL
jgi:Ca2+-binding RTX toxin-like protein